MTHGALAIFYLQPTGATWMITPPVPFCWIFCECSIIDSFLPWFSKATKIYFSQNHPDSDLILSSDHCPSKFLDAIWYNFTCTSKIYCISGRKCCKIYIGKTGRNHFYRFAERLCSARNNDIDKSVTQHSNIISHCVSDSNGRVI